MGSVSFSSDSRYFFPAVKKVFLEMGIYEETLPAVDKTEKDRAVDPSVIIRDPEIVVYLLQSIDMVIPHTVIFWKDNLHIVPPDLEFTSQSIDNIG